MRFEWQLDKVLSGYEFSAEQKFMGVKLKPEVVAFYSY